MSARRNHSGVAYWHLRDWLPMFSRFSRRKPCCCIDDAVFGPQHCRPETTGVIQAVKRLELRPVDKSSSPNLQEQELIVWTRVARVSSDDFTALLHH
jgi:hypothetical protein